MTTEELDALEAMAKAATPGSWEWAQPGYPDDLSLVLRAANGTEILRFNSTSHEVNTAYIAACDPTTVLALIAEARAAARLRTAMEGALEDLASRGECAMSDKRGEPAGRYVPCNGCGEDVFELLPERMRAVLEEPQP